MLVSLQSEKGQQHVEEARIALECSLELGWLPFITVD